MMVLISKTNSNSGKEAVRLPPPLGQKVGKYDLSPQKVPFGCLGWAFELPWAVGLLEKNQKMAYFYVFWGYFQSFGRSYNDTVIEVFWAYFSLITSSTWWDLFFAVFGRFLVLGCHHVQKKSKARSAQKTRFPLIITNKNHILASPELF